ncbi:MAG: phosphoribosyltransferase [Nanoarchaeota archaeon]
MSEKRELKRLSEDLVLALNWAAAEYYYFKELQKEFEIIGKKRDEAPYAKEARRVAKIVKYICSAERRTDQFEEKARKKNEDFAEELSKRLGENIALMDLIKGFRAIAKELNVEHAHLAAFASRYDGFVNEYIGKLGGYSAAHSKLYTYIKRSPDLKSEEQEKVSIAVSKFIEQTKEQVQDAQRWIAALEASLRKAYNYTSGFKLTEKKEARLTEKEENLKILHEQRWPFPDRDERTNFLVQQPTEDLRQLIKKMARYRYAHGILQTSYFFTEGMLLAIDPLMKKQITWKEIVEDLPMADLTEEGRSNLQHYAKLFIYGYLRVYLKLNKAGYFKYFPNHEETCKLYEFMRQLVHEVERSNVDFVYAIDRSGRILGFLLYQVLKKLGKLGKTKFYFMYATKEMDVALYSEKQKKEIRGKKVLLIDDFSSVGNTMTSTLSYLRAFGPEKVIPYVFASFGYRPLRGREDYHIVYDQEPSWFWKKEYSGLNEKPHGGVEVNKGAKEISRKVRKVLITFAEVIAEYYY